MIAFGAFAVYLIATGGVYAPYRAASRGDRKWLVRILLAWLLGVGWIVGLVYLWRSRRTATTEFPPLY